VHYQPRVRLRTRSIVGVEALLRWQRDGAPVSPATFIPVLEETGLILDVGRWVLQQVARDLAAWRAAGLPALRVAVNISAVQLRQRDFVAELATILAGAGEPGRFIDIEVTESMLLEDIEDAIVKLRAVQALGVQVALDDFGTGYSSLNYLGRLPINALKIDRSFVQRMRESAAQAAIVAAIVSLGRALKLEVVAEGVEQEQEEAMLAAFQCDEAQGYLFARPLASADLQQLVRTGGGRAH
jgi:EAL domain-containing protein (putative c-di-GMP-specific phosphodiesterase class I)